MRLVACDLDGTLLRSDGTASPATREVLAALPCPWVVVTGRPQRWLEGLFDAGLLPRRGTAIVGNGALTIDLATDAVLTARLLAPAAALAAAGAIRTAAPHVTFAVEFPADPVFVQEPDYPARFPVAGAPGAPLARLLDRPAAKLLCRSEFHDADALHAAASAVCDETAVTLTHSSGTDGLLEISAAGVDKAAALADYAAQLGVAAADVVAFGDGRNDVGMLRWAGHGVAVANAHPATRAAADEVTVSNDDDGVARVLARLFPA